MFNEPYDMYKKLKDTAEMDELLEEIEKIQRNGSNFLLVSRAIHMFFQTSAKVTPRIKLKNL